MLGVAVRASVFTLGRALPAGTLNAVAACAMATTTTRTARQLAAVIAFSEISANAISANGCFLKNIDPIITTLVPSL